jgi:hypothetical protein
MIPTIRTILTLGLMGCSGVKLDTQADLTETEGEEAEESAEDTGASDTQEDTDDPDPEERDTGEPDPDDEDTGEAPAPAAVDYSEPGPHSTSRTTSSLTASCASTVEIIAPTTPGDRPRLILAHGFMRGPAQMIGWAEHVASWGVEVAVPTLCHSSMWDTDHPQNGEDLRDWNAALGGGPVVYGGHSAGALAALIAASDDSAAVGLVGLDLTDNDGVGIAAGGGVDAPTFALAGEASSCNSSGNGVDAARAVDGARIRRVSNADHCDFENETDWMCTSFCPSGGSTFSEAEIQATIGAMLTAAVMSASGLDPDADIVWWQPGGLYYDDLAADGAVSAL